jgi:hypothetical protein
MPTNVPTNKVSLQGLAHIGEFIGGIAIIISLIYLAMQVSDSNRLLRSQAHFNAMTLSQSPIAMMIQNPELSDIIGRCQKAQSNLSEVALFRCHHYMMMELNGWEYLYYQNIDQSIPPELWLGADAYYRQEIQIKPGYRVFWKNYSTAYAEPFKTYANNLFTITDVSLPK